VNGRAKKGNADLPFLQLTITLTILSLAVACSSTPAEPQPNLHAWEGVSVETLDAHTFFKTVPMFRTRTAGGTEIRNYAYGYDFEECFTKSGAGSFGDLVDENAFIICSSSGIICNNIFYIKEEAVLEYAPTGRCDTDSKVQPESHTLRTKIQ
jgi:hypothetical protein